MTHVLRGPMMQDSPDQEGCPSVWGRVGVSSREDPRSASVHIPIDCAWGPRWWRARDSVFPIPYRKGIPYPIPTSLQTS